MERPALKIFFYPLVAGVEMSFLEISSRLKQKFGKGILQAASQIEFYSMTHREEGV